MGNSLGGRRKRAKVMKISGETFKIKTPAVAGDALRGYPGHVLLHSDAVKHFGVRAKPLDPGQALTPSKLYFLVQLPKFPEEDTFTNHEPPHRRVRSGIDMNAKDRLECLMLARRYVSDLSMGGSSGGGGGGGGGRPVRMKVRLPRAQVEKLVEESRNDGEVAEKIINLYMGGGAVSREREAHWKPGLESIGESFKVTQKKQVSFG